jgi:hypothetical protein
VNRIACLTILFLLLGAHDQRRVGVGLRN